MLTQAAVSGMVDRLRGLKENVIMGRIIPAGTGIAQHQDNLVGQHVDLVDDYIDEAQVFPAADGSDAEDVMLAAEGQKGGD